MLFSSLTFLWIFLPIVLIGNFILFKIFGTGISNIFLLIASLFFYAWGEPVYVLLMLVSILLNYLGGIAVSAFKHKRILLFCVISVNLLLLGVFKYADLVVTTINTVFSGNITLPGLALPIGISFYTFQAISYVVDVYRGDTDPQKNILNLALYISFFPQLIAGPIVKYKDINSQINNRHITSTKFHQGIGRFIYGLGKKVIISNTLSLFVDNVYSMPMVNVTPVMIWIASVLYALQLYYDFSGYSDMAIGLAKMFGFELKENFLYPYTSLSVKEYWKRWHISLSTWFKDYLYIPLGGSRKGRMRTTINLLIVFFLTGLWHGANYTFILWGLYQGVFLLIERTRFSDFLNKHKLIAGFYTFIVLNTGLVIFRSPTVKSSFAYIKRMFLPFLYEENINQVLEHLNPYTIFIAVISVLSVGFIQRSLSGKPIHEKWKGSVLETAFLMIILICCFMTLASNTYNPFIYFRF